MPNTDPLSVVAGAETGVVATAARWWWCPTIGLVIEGRWWEGRPMPPRNGVSIEATLWSRLAAEIQAAAAGTTTTATTTKQ